MTTPIQVVEIFTSIQGEGPSAGEPATFLRLANCNLSCMWCDTRHSWDWESFDKKTEVVAFSPEELIRQLLEEIPEHVRLLVLTGGEPLLQQATIAPVLAQLLGSRPDLRVEVETNGSIAPSAGLRTQVHMFVVSPKLANAGVPEKRRLRRDALIALSRTNSVAKFVVEGTADVDAAVEAGTAAGFDRQRIWVMPQTTSGSDLGRLIAELAPAAVSAGVKVSSRLHILAWGDTRGT